MPNTNGYSLLVKPTLHPSNWIPIEYVQNQSDQGLLPIGFLTLAMGWLAFARLKTEATSSDGAY